MKTDNKEMTVYVQPECEVIQILAQQMIATSGTTATQNEEYETGDTSNWF